MNIIYSCILSMRGFDLMDITRLFFSLHGYNIGNMLLIVAMIVVYYLLGHSHLMLFQTLKM